MLKRLFPLLLGPALAICLFPAPAEAETIYAVTTTNVLLTFDSATPGTIASSVAITGLVGGDAIVAIDLRPATGQLYALSSGSRLYVINPVTGVATQVGSAGAFTLSGTRFGFDFNPTVDRIRVVSDANQNLRLNPNDGTLTATDTSVAFAVGDPNFGEDPFVTGVAYTNNFAGALTTTLYDIEGGNLALLIQNPPNSGTLNTVGAVGVNFVTDFVGFDISGVSSVAYASLVLAGSPAGLYTINLATGAATLVGGIGTAGVQDITVGVQGVGPTPTPTATATVTPTSTATPTFTASPSPTTTLAPGGPAANVPTLSGWLLAVLALAIATAGLFVIRGSSMAG